MRWNCWGELPPHPSAALGGHEGGDKLRTFTISINDQAAAALEASAHEQRRPVEYEIAVLLEEITAGVADQIEAEAALFDAIRSTAWQNN